MIPKLRPLPRRYRDEDFNCRDCHLAFYGFMVHDSVWESAGYSPYDLACRPCLEKRLGRPLTMEDFTLVPLNFMNVDGFDTEDNSRTLYAKDGHDYDKTKAEYLERCARLGLEPKWITADGDTREALSGNMRKGPINHAAKG